MRCCYCKYDCEYLLLYLFFPPLNLSIFAPKRPLTSLMTSKLIYKRAIYIAKNGGLIAGSLLSLTEEDMSGGPQGATALSTARPSGTICLLPSELIVFWSHMATVKRGSMLETKLNVSRKRTTGDMLELKLCHPREIFDFCVSTIIMWASGKFKIWHQF